MEEISQSSEIVRSRECLCVFENCLGLLKKTTVALSRHDIAELEQCLESAGEWVRQLDALRDSPSFQRESSVDGQKKGYPSEPLESVRCVAREIQAASVLNTLLIDNGLRFSQTILSIICPPSTYGPLALDRSLAGADVPLHAIISVQS